MSTARLAASPVLLAFFLAPPCTAGGALPPALGAEVDSIFAPWNRDDRPGCAVGVERDGELAFARGYGMANLELGVPISTATVFDVGSVSKQFTAAAIALLAADGKLDLDDDVHRFIPELPAYPAPVTIRHLLHHRGGLKDYIEVLEAAGADEADVTTAKEALTAIVGRSEVDFPAGSRFAYSNTGYFLLGVVVERASGVPLARFAGERLFAPLGMKSTHFHADHTELVPHRATAYSIPLGSSRVAISESDWEQVGDGSLRTSVEDLARWAASLESGEPFGKAYLALMSSPGVAMDAASPELTYGMGQFHGSWNGRPAIRHGGAWVGFRAHLLRLPGERLAVAILCNAAEAVGLGEKAERVAAAALSVPSTAAAPTLLIRNAMLVDGTGAKRRRGDLRVEGERIAAVGRLKPRAGETVIDAGGKVLAPGFIDTHSHADDDLGDHRDALGAVSQGITTIVGGQDGGSALPLADFFGRLEWAPPALNVASYVGHGTLRDRVMGSDFRRPATAAEIAAMSKLLDEEMAAGALGLSSGLEYDPGIYSSTEELVALARVAARHGGRYISHVRSEDRRFWEAIEEILEIGREARIPVQISHVKLAMRSLWGEAPRLLERLERARREGVDVTADIYPYLYWHSTLTVLFPERDFENLETAQFVLDQVAPPEGLLLGHYLPEPAWGGMTVAEIAKITGASPAETLVDLIRRAEAMRAKGAESVEDVIGTSMTEGDLGKLLAWKQTNLCTDGALDGSHPRGFGAYPRVLGRYVREGRLLSLEEAVRKMTSLAADHVGIRDRGRLVPGAYADLVLFDPETVIDSATTAEPHALSAGIERVWVNGQPVFESGRPTGQLPGKVLRREVGPPAGR